jgi:hypothetical protein
MGRAEAVNIDRLRQKIGFFASAARIEVSANLQKQLVTARCILLMCYAQRLLN